MNLHPKRPKYANMHGKSLTIWNRCHKTKYLQSLKNVTSIYKNMQMHGNPGSDDITRTNQEQGVY